MFLSVSPSCFTLALDGFGLTAKLGTLKATGQKAHHPLEYRSRDLMKFPLMYPQVLPMTLLYVSPLFVNIAPLNFESI
jgi:hypothetical protein